jgi:hypothetical protein
MFNLIMDGSRDSMKQLKTHKISFKQPQNKAKLNSKSTPRSKGDKTRVKHGHLQKQSNLTNLGDEVGMKVNTLDMPRGNVKTRTIKLKLRQQIVWDYQ